MEIVSNKKKDLFLKMKKCIKKTNFKNIFQCFQSNKKIFIKEVP